MLKIILTINCDICGDSFEGIGISTDRNPQAWDYMPALLEMRAQGHGWNCEWVHHCPDCFADMTADSQPEHAPHASAQASTEDDF